jgi:DNA-binding response OmpR family regulator
MKPRILCVDDSRVAILLKKHLIRAGYDVELARTPEQAEKDFGGQEFDLVISDVYFGRTPDRGIKFISDQVRLGRRVLITSAIDVYDDAELYKMNLPFLEKPFTFDELDGLVSEVIKTSQRPHFNPKKFEELIISHIDDPWTKQVKKTLQGFEELPPPEKRKLMLEIELEQLRREIKSAQGHNLGRKELNELVAKYLRTRRGMYGHNGLTKPRLGIMKEQPRELGHRPKLK